MAIPALKPTTTQFKRGDIREDGMMFWEYKIFNFYQQE
jgi:hypothetical protein